MNDGFPGLGQFTVTTALSGHVHNHRATLHVLNHGFAYDARRGAAGNGGGGDHHIGSGHMPGQDGLLLLFLRLGQLACVTAGAFSRDVNIHKFCAQ